MVKGPSVERAFDASGAANASGSGFCAEVWTARGSAASAAAVGCALRLLVVRREGSPTPEVLAESLAGLVAGIKIGKTMRWNASGVAFSRPIRWFVLAAGRNGHPVGVCRVDRGTYDLRAVWCEGFT